MSDVEQFQNGTATDGDVDEQVWGAKYTVGGFSVGYQQTDEETGNTTYTGYENVAYGITFNVNDDLSIGYGHTNSNQKGGTSDAEADAFQAAYTMGGATFRIADVSVDNQTYGTVDYKSTIISLGLAF
jgi:outer membrane protein OmpU